MGKIVGQFPTGRPRKLDLNRPSPVPREVRLLVRPGAPARPPGLSKGARVVWDRLTPEMVAARRLTPVDGPMWAGFCTWLALAEGFDAFLLTHGPAYVNPRTRALKPRPEVWLGERAWEMVGRFGRRFGL